LLHNESNLSQAPTAKVAVEKSYVSQETKGLLDYSETELQQALEDADEIVRQQFRRPASILEAASDIVKYSPDEMRNRLLTELRRQEDIFKYAIELVDIEKAYTLHSANEVVTSIMQQAENTLMEHQRQQEMVLQQQAYEVALASAMASAQVALEKEAMACNKTVEDLKFQLQQQGVYQQYIQYFMQAAQSAGTIEKAVLSSSIDPGVDDVINLSQSFSGIDDTFITHGAEAMQGIDIVLENLKNAPDSNRELVYNATKFKENLLDLISDQVLVLRGKLKAIQIKKEQKLDVLRSNRELLKSPKYKNDPVLYASMKATLKRTFEEAEQEYEFSRVELEKLRWTFSTECFAGMQSICYCPFIFVLI
jgi:hypothetical protein